MKALNLITFLSDLNEQGDIRTAHKELFDTLESAYQVSIIRPEDYVETAKDEFCLTFISSGGTESKFVENFDKIPQPIKLITDGLQNSLAASLEINSWAREKNVPCTIIHAKGEELLREIDNLHKVYEARKTLNGCKIGVIGKPSSWLIASSVDFANAKEKWGVEFVDIPLEEVDNEFETADEKLAETIADDIIAKATSLREPKANDMIQAAKLYLAIKKVAENHGLKALTIQCFSLIPTTKTTGCLALSLLNDKGIVAGCEGDEQTVFTMVLANALTGSPGFMCNPSQIDKPTNTMLFAHCTIGAKQTSSYKLRSHFESGIGVALQGEMPNGNYTIVKCGGRNLDKLFTSKAELVENTDFNNVCRTQIRIRLESPVDYFLTNPIGNHHVILEGDWKELFEAMFE